MQQQAAATLEGYHGLGQLSNRGAVRWGGVDGVDDDVGY